MTNLNHLDKLILFNKIKNKKNNDVKLILY